MCICGSHGFRAWLTALRAVNRGQHPQRESTRNVPAGAQEGWAIAVPSARDSGTEFIYKVWWLHSINRKVVVSLTKSENISRILFRMSYGYVLPLFPIVLTWTATLRT